jgi:hypothetical protein
MWDNVLSGAMHFQRRELPPPRHPVRQFFHGLCLPFHLARALLSDPAARRRYVRVGSFQAMAILALGLMCTGSADKAGDVAIELKFWAKLLAAMQILQWIVVALSRDYHDAISRDASLLTGVPPEDEPLTPRVRLDVAWVRKKLSRRIRALLVFLAGLPALFMLTAPLPSRQDLLSVLIPAWSAYWLVVFTAAKSARAWDEEATAGAPWFLRAWIWLTTRVPGLRWGFLQRYGRFWENRTRSVFSPAAEVERQPWAFAGLSVIRALAILPLLKCFLRPLVPVAAAHLLVAQRAAAAPPPSELPAPPAEPPAAAATAA